jgi:hypothetical protein
MRGKEIVLETEPAREGWEQEMRELYHRREIGLHRGAKRRRGVGPAVWAVHDLARAHVRVVGRQVEHHLERLEHPARLIGTDDAHRHVAAKVRRGLDVERVTNGLRRGEEPIGGGEDSRGCPLGDAVPDHVEEPCGFARLDDLLRDVVDPGAGSLPQGGDVDQRDLVEFRSWHGVVLGWLAPLIDKSPEEQVDRRHAEPLGGGLIEPLARELPVNVHARHAIGERPRRENEEAGIRTL